MMKSFVMISLMASAFFAHAGQDAKANCQAQLGGTMDKPKAQKAQEGAATVFGTTQSGGKKPSEPPKTDR